MGDHSLHLVAAATSTISSPFGSSRSYGNKYVIYGQLNIPAISCLDLVQYCTLYMLLQ
jgi:hypothetical protein